MSNLYYTAPSDTAFEEVKSASIEVWSEKSDLGSYRTEKIDQIKDIKNVGDNFMYMIAMFDSGNQRKVVEKLGEETKQAVRERMIDGGNDEQIINQIGL